MVGSGWSSRLGFEGGYIVCGCTANSEHAFPPGKCLTIISEPSRHNRDLISHVDDPPHPGAIHVVFVIPSHWSPRAIPNPAGSPHPCPHLPAPGRLAYGNPPPAMLCALPFRGRPSASGGSLQAKSSKAPLPTDVGGDDRSVPRPGHARAPQHVV